MINRVLQILLTVSCLWSGSTMAADYAATPTRQVVFVCEHGTVKSLMATRYFNAMAEQKGINVRAISRAVTPDPDPVPRKIADNLKQEGFDVTDFRATVFQEADLQSAVRVVTIGAKPKEMPGLKEKSEAWDDVPPASQDFRVAGNVLKRHIDALLAALAKP